MAPGGGFLESLPAGSPNRYGRGRDVALANSGRCCGGHRPSTAVAKKSSSITAPVRGAGPLRPGTAQSTGALLRPPQPRPATAQGRCGAPAFRVSSAGGTWQVGSAADWQSLASGDWGGLTGSGAVGGFGAPEPVSSDPMLRPRSALPPRRGAAVTADGLVDGLGRDASSHRGVPPGPSAALMRTASLGSYSAHLDKVAALEGGKGRPPIHGRPVGGPHTAVRAMHRASSGGASSSGMALMGEPIPIHMPHEASQAAAQAAALMAQSAARGGGTQHPTAAPSTDLSPEPTTTPLMPLTLNLDLRQSITHARALGGSRPGSASQGVSGSRQPSSRRPTSAASRPMSANTQVRMDAVSQAPLAPRVSSRPGSAANRPMNSSSRHQEQEPWMPPDQEPWMTQSAAEVALFAGFG